MHTDAMRDHARRLRGPSARMATAAATARGSDGAGAFGPVGTAFAGEVLLLARLAADGLGGTAEAVRATAEGIEAMADAYEAVENWVCTRFGG